MLFSLSVYRHYATCEFNTSRMQFIKKAIFLFLARCGTHIATNASSLDSLLMLTSFRDPQYITEVIFCLTVKSILSDKSSVDEIGLCRPWTPFCSFIIERHTVGLLAVTSALRTNNVIIQQLNKLRKCRNMTREQQITRRYIRPGVSDKRYS